MTLPTKTCKDCGQSKLIVEFEFVRGKWSRNPYPRTTCKTCRKEQKSLYHRRIKTQVVDGYGGCCVCCGETALEFLTIHHINGGGTQHRKSLSKEGTSFYRWVINNGFPKDLTVLCYNCNCCLEHYKRCPHEFMEDINDL